MVVVTVTSSSAMGVLGFRHFIYTFCWFFIDLQLKSESCQVVFPSPV